MNFKICNKCRICGSSNLSTVLEFSDMPLLAEPVKPGSTVPSSPLTVKVCQDCGYVFLREVIDSDVYNDYIYTPQASSDVVAYLQDFVAKISSKHNIKPGMRGLEIGSGDGSLCREFQKAGVKFIGVEPSKVLSEISVKQNGVETINAFMSIDCARQFGRVFDLVVVRHVLEHIDDFNGFFKSIDECLNDDGVLIVEVPYLGDIVCQKQFYAFFFEHLSYFSAKSLSDLVGKYGFYINHSEFVHPEGGSILVHISRKKSEQPSERPDFAGKSLLDLKSAFGDFQKKFNDLIASSGPIAAYGAGQRGVTLLNLLGATHSNVLAIYDENPVYSGLITPVSGIVVHHPSKMSDLPPAAKVLILASSYDAQIRLKYKNIGDRFVSISDLVNS